MTIEVSTLSEVGGTSVSPRVDRTAYLAQLLSLRSQLTPSPSWLSEIRENASERVQELAIPSTRDEDWRFTDLADLLKFDWKTPQDSPALAVPLQVPEAQRSLVFVNGQFAPQFSAIATDPGSLWVGNLATALAYPELADRLQRHLAKQLGSEEVFTALNTASFADIAVIWVPCQVQVLDPVYLLYLNTSDSTACVVHPRCWVVAESSSQLTLVEEYLTDGEGHSFTNAVTEIWLDENAIVNHSRIQHESLNSFHIGKTVVTQLRDSTYTGNAITWGGAVSRHNFEITSQGEQTQTHLNGLTRIQGQQVADTHSAIAHTRPYGTSRQVHKCIVSDRAHAVFNGRVLVPQAAQLTDAAQLSRNLLLSPRARVDTKPQLEIVADNVKCSHGATVSQLEEDEIFYLQSRGLDRAAACELLVYAFATDILNRIPVESVRDRLIQQLAIISTPSP